MKRYFVISLLLSLYIFVFFSISSAALQDTQAVWHLYYRNKALTGWRIEDWNNGFFEPAENGLLDMILYNSGGTLTQVYGQMYQAYGAYNYPITDNTQQYWSDTNMNVYTISSSSSSYIIQSDSSVVYDHPIFEWEMSGVDGSGGYHRWLDRMGITCAVNGLLCYAWDSIDDLTDIPNGTYGNGNGILEPGETILLEVGLMNNTDYPATLTTPVYLSTPDTFLVTLVDPVGNYQGSRVNADTVAFNHTDSFKLFVGDSCPDNHVINLSLALKYNIDVAAVPWAWSYDEKSKTIVPNNPLWRYNLDSTITISTTIPFNLYMGSFNFYELPNRRHSLRIVDDATMNTSTTWANSDNTANPGETIEIRLRLWNRSVSDYYDHVVAWLSPADSYTRDHVTFLNATCNFTDVAPRGISTQIAPYYKLKLADDYSQSSMRFYLYVSDSSSNPPRIRWNTDINIPVAKGRPRYVPGFPIYIGSAIKSSPALVDLNRNGITDIIVGAQDSTVYAIEYDWPNSVANSLPGWPKPVDDAVFASPAVGDIFGNDQNYVVAATMYGSIYIWDSTGTLLTGWPVTLPGNPVIESTPVLADVDHDGRLDVIIAARQTRIVYCYDVLTGLKWFSSASSELNSTPAVANFLNDTSGYLQTVYASQGGILSVVDHHGQLLWQSSAGGSFYSSPAVADLDNDGNLELVIGCNDQQLYTYRYNRTTMTWETFSTISVMGSIVGSPVIGSLQGDGKLSVVFGTNASKVLGFAWDSATNGLKKQWKVSVGDAISNSPAMGDINGDLLREVVIGAQDGKLYWFQDNGLIPIAWQDFNPLTLLGTRIDGSPAIGDIMGNHKCCVVVGDNSGYLYAVAMDGPSVPAPYYSERMDWPMFHHEPQRTGWYAIPERTPLNTNGTFSKAFDTTHWYIQAYGDASPTPGLGALSWLPSFGTQSGVLELQQNIGQKGKLTQVFSVPSSGWYTAYTKVATNVSNQANQQKVYLYLQELAKDSSIAATGNTVIAYGQGGLGAASTWRDIQISFYATNTLLGIQLVGINHQANGIDNARLYIDYILVYPEATISTTYVTLTNPSFTSNTSGWLYQIYADGTGPGTWSWVSSWSGQSGILKGIQAGGEKGKISQMYGASTQSTYGSVMVYSAATSMNNTQKVYMYIYSYDSGYHNVIESGNAILQAGKWTPGKWRQLQFSYTPLTEYNTVQLVGINPSGNPNQTIYLDAVHVKQ
ncbi:MAG: hypothetical protein ACE14V_01860 [bacterium]